MVAFIPYSPPPNITSHPLPHHLPLIVTKNNKPQHLKNTILLPHGGKSPSQFSCVPHYRIINTQCVYSVPLAPIPGIDIAMTQGYHLSGSVGQKPTARRVLKGSNPQPNPTSSLGDSCNTHSLSFKETVGASNLIFVIFITTERMHNFNNIISVLAEQHKNNIKSLLVYTKTVMALKAPSDWLLKLRIFALHLRATRAGFAPENIVIVAGINELKSSFLATGILSH